MMRPEMTVLAAMMLMGVQLHADERAAPYSPSQVITTIEWAPKESIVRKAKGSDRFPMTWADDDHQYTTCGDGTGFLEQFEVKVDPVQRDHGLSRCSMFSVLGDGF